MDFALLPPEVNSARMYSGPGSGPMLAAASAWDAVAAELHAAGLGYETAVSELSTEWAGPAQAAMAAAATSFADWLLTVSGQAEQTAVQARAAVAGYETAYAMTVPPVAVAANRSQLMTLLATNFLGQNTGAIAANEAHYAQMWAQDTAAMYGYAASAAAASRLTPFAEPPQTTNPSGAANQALTSQAAATAAAGHTQTAVSAMTQALQGLAAPAAAAAPSGTASLAGVAPVAAVEPGVAMSIAALASSLFGTFVIDSAGTFGVDVAGTFGIDLIGVGEIGSELLPYAELASTAAPATAALGEAASIGGLSVPPAWTVAAPSVVQQVGTAMPAAGAAAVPAVTAGEAAIPFAEMAAAGLAGRATAGIGRGRGAGGKTSRKRPAPARPPHPDQPQRPANGPITRISAELRELADLHNAGILTAEEFTEEKRHLLGR